MLIIGDGCTDDSEEVVASFRDPRLYWHNLPHNSGIQSATNNAGLRLARGRYIAYLGHDDVWYPSHLALLTKALQETDAGLSYTFAVMIGPPDSGVRVLTGYGPATFVGYAHMRTCRSDRRLEGLTDPAYTTGL